MRGFLVSGSAERKALNEGVFRDANEKLEQRARLVLDGDDTSPVPFFCECPQKDCRAIVLLSLEEYEAVRANPRGGLAAIGHDDPSIEKLLYETDRFVVTEKFGKAGEVHAEHDPRQEDERLRRIGENESLYRQVNERVEELNDAFGTVTGVFEVTCECGSLECAEQISVPRDVYERVRLNAAHFIVMPGHEFPEAEHVVEGHEAYVIVHKEPGAARRVAEETDTRS
jgi:hypothetical protein